MPIAPHWIADHRREGDSSAGRMSAPATIQATQELMAAKGGAAEDIARLTKGEFYFSTDGFNRPVKVHTCYA